MKKLHYFLILISFMLIQACSEDRPFVIQTKSGLYGSKEAQFLIGFPKKPTILVDHQVIEGYKLDRYIFATRDRDGYEYYVSYYDLDEEYLEEIGVEDFMDTYINEVSSGGIPLKISSKEVVEKTQFDKCIIYHLESSSFNSTYLSVKLIKYETRFYIVSFAATRGFVDEPKRDAFLKSFKVYKPK